MSLFDKHWYTGEHLILLWVLAILLIAAGAIGQSIYTSIPTVNRSKYQAYSYINIFAILFGLILFGFATTYSITRCKV